MFVLCCQSVIYSVEGLDLKTETGQPFTFAKACAQAAVGNHESDARETIEHKMKRWELFKKLSQPGQETVSLNAEETVLLKERLHLSYGPLVLGQILDSLGGY